MGVDINASIWVGWRAEDLPDGVIQAFREKYEDTDGELNVNGVCIQVLWGYDEIRGLGVTLAYHGWRAPEEINLEELLKRRVTAFMALLDFADESFSVRPKLYLEAYYS